MALCMTENSSTDKERDTANTPLVMAVNTMDHGKTDATMDSGTLSSRLGDENVFNPEELINF